MENRKATEAGQDITMQKEDFAALWKTIHLKVTDTYEAAARRPLHRILMHKKASATSTATLPIKPTASPM